VTPGPRSETQPGRPPLPTSTPEPALPPPPPADPADPVTGQFQAAQPAGTGTGTVEVVLDVHIYDRGVANTEASKEVTVRVPAGQSPAAPDRIVVDGRTYTRATPGRPLGPAGQPRPVTVTYEKDLTWPEAALKAAADEWDRQTRGLGEWWKDFTADPSQAIRCAFVACPPPPGPPGQPSSGTESGAKGLPTDIPWPGESPRDD
jgi:hypothetical protein